MTARHTVFALVAALLMTGVGAAPVVAEEVGKVGVDWFGNDIIIDAISDPEVQGVTCHIAYFERGLIDRLQKGNWFEDPSNSAIDCTMTGKLIIGDIDLDRGGEEVFKERRSIVFKTLVINRIYDPDQHALIYLGHTREVQNGSAKMSISVIPLDGADVTWTEGDPRQRVEPVT